MWFTEYFTSILSGIFTSAYLISVLLIIGVMMLENRSPVKTLSWILVLLLIPFAGVVLYIFFGQNFRKQKIIRRKGLKNHTQIQKLAHAQSINFPKSELSRHEILKAQYGLILLQLNNSNSVVKFGNRVKLLLNGASKFESLKADLLEAKQFIHMQYYILAEDNIGNEMVAILKNKAKEGVEVRVIVDDVGSWDLKSDYFDDLRSYGIEIFTFLKVRFPGFTSKVNYRNHRKIVIIDGEVAYLGGINIADRYIHGSKKLGAWRDTHLKIEGEAVSSLQTIFSIDWYFVSQKELIDSKYYPPVKAIENKVLQISTSGPDSDWPAIMMGFLKLISTAKDYVYIASPYFMPTESILMALKVAAMGGVDVRIVIPDKSDAHITKYSSRSYVKEMINAGVKVYLYQSGFIHSKVIVSDDAVASVGSSNMDFRSFEQNFEVTAFVYDKAFAVEVRESLENDFSNSKIVLPHEWKKRPLSQKAKESFARLFSPLL